MVVGSIPFALIFGAVAMTSGLSPVAAFAMSTFVFAGSAQLVSMGLLATGTALPIIFLTTLVINLRLVFYSALLGSYVKHLPQRWILPLAFWLTDHSFVVTVKRYEEKDDSPYKHWYYLGSAVFMYSNWLLWTVVGIVAGQSIENPRALGLEFAATVTFIAMLIPMLRSRPALIAAVVAGVMAVLAFHLPNQLGLLVATLSGMMAGYLAQNMGGAPNLPVTPAKSEAKS